MGFAWVFQLIMGRMLAKTVRFRNEERWVLLHLFLTHEVNSAIILPLFYAHGGA